VPAFAVAAQDARVVTKQQAGEWKVEVRRTPVGSPRRHVVRCRFEAWRWAPQATEPQLLCVEESTRGLRTHLRHDGLCVVEVRGAPWLVFADGTKVEQPLEPMLQLGDVLLWVNRGAGGTDMWQHVPEPWRRRELRAFDLRQRAVVPLATLDDQTFGSNAEAILGLLERETANRVAEFELWAIPRFGELRLIRYTDRIVQLLGNAKSAVADWDRNGDVGSRLRELRRVYARALLQLLES
jgi:hypothetical protein